MIIKKMLCLANSKKHSGRCIAGIEHTDSEDLVWIRPVSDRLGEEVSENERQYPDGKDPQVLDIIQVPLIHPKPHACQTENWLLDPDYYWELVGRADWTMLQSFVQTPTTLWPNGHSTYHGCNDELPVAISDKLTNSLYFIFVPQVTVSVFAPGEAFGNPKRRSQGKFNYHGSRYAFWITDPQMEREYLAKANGEYPIGECFLTISLSEPFTKSGHAEQYRYKLIAAIIRRTDLE